MRILLACAGGFSTSMLVVRMREAASKQAIEVLIEAIAETEIEESEGFDLLLLGPQLAHRLEDLSSELACPVLTIDPTDYGMMNGEKVLNNLLEYLDKK